MNILSVTTLTAECQTLLTACFTCSMYISYSAENKLVQMLVKLVKNFVKFDKSYYSGIQYVDDKKSPNLALKLLNVTQLFIKLFNFSLRELSKGK